MLAIAGAKPRSCELDNGPDFLDRCSSTMNRLLRGIVSFEFMDCRIKLEYGDILKLLLNGSSLPDMKTRALS
jgi:hypothetical protein